ncbi:MAG: hypothetical protein HYX94_06300 [Chloroflexi bacterium]|nr:hypothetical protein [Chloroflexota bacterium]
MSDPNAPAVTPFTFEGRPVVEIARSGDAPGSVETSTGVAVGVKGDVFVADRAKKQILRFIAEH